MLNKITPKLLLGFLLAGFLPLLIYGSLTYLDFQQTLKQEILDRLEALTSERLENVENYAEDLRKEVTLLARSPDFAHEMIATNTSFEQINKNPKQFEASREALLSLLKQYQADFEYRNFLLINVDGDVVFSESDTPKTGSNLYLDPTGVPGLTSVFNVVRDTLQPALSTFRTPSAASDKPSIYSAAPVFSDGELVGVIAKEATGVSLKRIVQDYDGLGTSGEIVLASRIDDKAVVVAPLRHDPGAAFSIKMQIGSANGVPMQKAVEGESGHGISVDYRGKEILAYWKYLPELDLGLVLKLDTDEVYQSLYAMRRQAIIFGIITLLAIVLGGWFSARSLSAPLRKLTEVTDKTASGDLTQRISLQRSDEIGKLASSFDEMIDRLQAAQTNAKDQDWLKTGLSRLNDTMRGDPEIMDLARRVISEMAGYLNIQVGIIYVNLTKQTDAKKEQDSLTLSLAGSYAYKKRKSISNEFKLGEGLVGQAALEKQQILVSNVSDDYIKVSSGLGEQTPLFICVTPCLFEEQVMGVIEIGSLQEVTDLQLAYLEQAMPSLGIALESARGRTRLAEALKESLNMSRQLQTQQEELKASNEELEEQTQQLEKSKSRLQTQQEELQVMNEELEAKNELAERQKNEVELARSELEEKAESLALASKYKSEFLANMSHELRTPLNSLLLLSQSLMQNKESNLSDAQLESVNIIHSSGSDLLNLINEILDLSKIESGRMLLNYQTVSTNDLANNIKSLFGHMAEDKGLDLNVTVDDNCLQEIEADEQRLVQVLRNLVSNAIKFTREGSVNIRMGLPSPNAKLTRPGLPLDKCLAISVSDTGIGISPEQAKIIFEAFQQADGGTARQYGGTGLGLAISKELMRVFGGEIQLESALGEGSTFTVYLPVEQTGENDVEQTAMVKGNQHTARSSRYRSGQPAGSHPDDDRRNLEEGDKVMLIIEDDLVFMKFLAERCQQNGMKCLLATSGEEGLDLALEHLPDAVILDIRLPGMDGWAVLDELKENTKTRHIPVHVVSGEEAPQRALRAGAIGHAVKPIDLDIAKEIFDQLRSVSSGQPQKVLVVEDDDDLRRSTVKLISAKDVHVEEAATGEQALEALRKGGFACVVLDLQLPGISGKQLLAQLEQEKIEVPPVIVHTAGNLTHEDEMNFRSHEGAIVIKDVRSQERLLDEVSLFLHRVIREMPRRKREIITNLHDNERFLSDRKILIVDDDMRTTFAMAKLLNEHGANALKAENGVKALALLEKHPDTAVILMDIMMPVMDGYETIKHIREQEQFTEIPIIALTAKAMSEDRNKCIEAGASDYLSKPVDFGRLISMMRVWLNH